MNNSMQNGYAPAPMNGASGGMKRGRDEEEEQRPLSGGPGMDMKRRKTLALDTAPAQAVYQPAPAVAAPTRRR
jgi:protein SOK2